MAALVDTNSQLKGTQKPQKKRDGTLVTDVQGNLVSSDRAQTEQLSAAAGLAATPTTPGGVLGVGGSPDAAKMAGTPQALAGQTGITAPTPAGGRKLADVQAAEEFGPQADQAARAAADAHRAEAERLRETYGGLGDRVQTMMDQFALPTKAAPGAPPTPQISVGSSDDGGPAVQRLEGTSLAPAAQNLAPAARAALEAFMATGTPEAQRAALEALPPGANIQDFIHSTTLAEAAGAAAPTSLPLDDALAAQLGFEGGIAGIARELGVPEDAIRGKPLSALTQIAEEHAQRLGNEVAGARAALADPALGPNERRAARRALAAAGETGALATAEQMDALDAELRSATTVEFMGQHMPLEELLGSDRFTATAAEWANSAPGSEFRKRLAAEEPGLSKWLEEHEPIIQDAATALSGRVEGFQKLQKDARAAADRVAAENAISVEDVQRMMQLADKDYDPSRLVTSVPVNPDILEYFLGNTEQLRNMGLDRATAAQQLAALSKNDPDAFRAILAKGSTELRDLGFGKVGADAELGFRVGGLSQIKDNDVASTLDYVFGISADEARKFVTRAEDERAAGVRDPAKDAQLAVLDANRDGALDSPREIAARSRGLAAKGELAAGATEGGIYGSLTENFASKTAVTPEAAQAEIDHLVGTGNYSPDKIRALTDALGSRGLLPPETMAKFELASNRYNSADFVAKAMAAPATGIDSASPEVRAANAIRQLRKEAKPYMDPGWIDEFLAARPDIAATLAGIEGREAAEANRPSLKDTKMGSPTETYDKVFSAPSYGGTKFAEPWKKKSLVYQGLKKLGY